MGGLSFVVFLIALLVASTHCYEGEWIKVRTAPKEVKVTINIALIQSNLAVLESTLLDISDPTSPNYGNWWTREAITELVAPPLEVSTSVVAFLKEHGVNEVEDRRDSIKVTAPVNVIEDILKVSLYHFTHSTKGKNIIRSSNQYTVPSEISRYVDFISGLIEFPPVRSLASRRLKAGVDALIVPETLNYLYQTPKTFPVHPNSSMCVAEFLDDTAILSEDIDSFANGTATPVIKIQHIVGNFSGSNLESTLDVEYGGSTALNTSFWFWSSTGWMYDFAVDVMAATDAPLVVSMSWGWPENDQCGKVINCTKGETALQYINRTNIEFQKLGLRGITLLASSGDQGAPGDLNSDCNRFGKNIFSSIFPGASPWVLSIGATMLTNSTTLEYTPPICAKYGCATSTTEIVCTCPQALITTGGGFSDYSAMPSWQQPQVAAYLKNPSVELPPDKLFNATNRGFPDVSALGHNFVISIDGGWTLVDGTSASAPLWGALISLLNSQRLNDKKSPLGFISPLIYQAYSSDSSMFNDVTSGNNKCTEYCCDHYGYEAADGWDPVTGLGTPVFPKLLQYVAGLP